MKAGSLFRPSFKRILLVCLIIILTSLSSTAQLCEGSLGDPVVNLTFGSGGGSSSYAPSDSYSYVSDNCPGDGFYTITNYTSGCFGNTWHTVTDHTGGGAFMLVNASYDPGDFFVTTVSDLCPNTTYEFAAWVMNVMKGTNSILPNLTFSVETPAGELLNTFSTGDIAVTASPKWEQYGFYFSTPASSPVIVLRITNNAPGGTGNDLALDDITFRPCGAKIGAHIVDFDGGEIDLCEGDVAQVPYKLTADISDGYLSPSMQWQQSIDEGKTWVDISDADELEYTLSAISEAGNYWYRMTVAEADFADVSTCRIASEILKVNVHPKPLVDAGPDKVMLQDNPIELDGSIDGDYTDFSWTPDVSINDTGQLNPIVSPLEDIIYTLSAASEWGCHDSDRVRVKVIPGIYVPNAFTPNGDGINDRWQIPSLDPLFEAEVSVFNRWGQKVYQVSSSPVSWDGRFAGEPQDNGVYSYIIVIKEYNIKLKGSFRLIR